MPSSPLQPHHEDLGARFTDFAGWQMPVQYEGVLAEHLAVRRSVGAFDVSHLGRFRVEGPGATDLLRRQLCNDVADITPGRAQYTMALNQAGGVEDDIIVWRWDDEKYWVLPNGANYDEIHERFRSDGPSALEIEPLQFATALVAVQGPEAPDLLQRVFGSAPGRFRLTAADYHGVPVAMAGTGYTGERGAEVAFPNEDAGTIWNALLEAGAVPCGLGARDTLRLEMGYPLWGQDLDPQTTPLEAGLSWVVGWDHDFIGREALDRQRRDGLEKLLVAFRTEGRAIPRHGYPLRSGASIGEVASGNFSPVLERGIGMGYLAPPNESDPIEVQIRGKWIPVERTRLPFLNED
jgi:aminomethyltransferase